jgi:hypothetical protein
MTDKVNRFGRRPEAIKIHISDYKMLFGQKTESKAKICLMPPRLVLDSDALATASRRHHSCGPAGNTCPGQAGQTNTRCHAYARSTGHGNLAVVLAVLLPELTHHTSHSCSHMCI